MPVVTFERADLCRLIGREFDLDTLARRMPMLGGDVDRVEGDAITIEWFPDRPDLLTAEGTGRALRAFLDVRPGMPKYDAKAARTELRVDPSVVAVRPFAALCFVRGLTIDAAFLEQIIAAQEKLTLAPGRKRRKIAIGIHDAAPGGKPLPGPFTYMAVRGDEKPFVPLAWPDGDALTPAEIMARHPKGQEYGHLIPTPAAAADRRFPVFLDGAGAVLSLPPVINAAKTTVTRATRDVLIDVTGTEAASVRHTVALLATGFAERGGTIEAVTVHDASGTWTCPDLTPREQVLIVEDANRWLGTSLDAEDMVACLARLGHEAEAFNTKLLVHSPAWRFDLLHPVDWYEDIAIGYGFENFAGKLPARISYGDALEHQALEDRLRVLMVGHGFYEVRTLTLTDPARQWSNWGADAPPHVRVRNPVLEDRTILRTWLTPSLLEVLAANRHRPLPQRLFEIGYVVVAEDGAYRNRLRLAVVEQAAKTGFSAAKGLAEAIVRDAGLDVDLVAGDRPGLIQGRTGHFVRRHDGAVVGWFGEVHPDTLVAFGLGAATVAVELDVSAFVVPA